MVEGAGVRSDVEGEGKDGEEVRVWRMERVGVGSLGYVGFMSRRCLGGRLTREYQWFV